jgi:hemerythrin-like domain-containing protein
MPMERIMAEPLSVWHTEHVNFARLLDLLEARIARFQNPQPADHTLLANVVWYLRNFADRYHHPREDEAFARLARRDPAILPVIDRLAQEHRVIATAGEDLFDHLDEAAKSGDAQAGLEAAAADYLAHYRRHIGVEEREVMPRAAELLTPDDWRAVAESSEPDPLFGDVVEVRFQALRSQLAEYGRTSRRGTAR